MPRLSSRRVNPGARNIPYTIRGRRDARRAGAWGLAADSGRNTGRQAPGMESTVKHSQLCHLPAAVLSTPISQRTTEIILKPMKGLNLQKTGLAETWEEFNPTVLWMRSQQDAHTSGPQNPSTSLVPLLTRRCRLCLRSEILKPHQTTFACLQLTAGSSALGSQKSWNVMSLNWNRWPLLPTFQICDRLKVQCVGFIGIYWQRWNIMFITMFS